jgi:hypothetical protein
MRLEKPRGGGWESAGQRAPFFLLFELLRLAFAPKVRDHDVREADWIAPSTFRASHTLESIGSKVISSV